MSEAARWGWGKWGTKRTHYRPSPAEIRALCQVIRERGYKDLRGHQHPPWNDYTELERRVTLNPTVEVKVISSELNVQLEALGELNGESI